MQKRTAVAGTGVGTVLAAASGALINELHAGWPWWVAAGGTVLTSAFVAMWLTWSSPDRGEPSVGAHDADRSSAMILSTGARSYVVDQPSPTTRKQQSAQGGAMANQAVLSDTTTHDQPLASYAPPVPRMAKVTISRTRRSAGALGKVVVFVNGRDVGVLRNGQDLTTLVSPGRHTIYVRYPLWGGSSEFEFDAQVGSEVLLGVEPTDGRKLENYSRTGGWKIVRKDVY